MSREWVALLRACREGLLRARTTAELVGDKERYEKLDREIQKIDELIKKEISKQ